MPLVTCASGPPLEPVASKDLSLSTSKIFLFTELHRDHWGFTDLDELTDRDTRMSCTLIQYIDRVFSRRRRNYTGHFAITVAGLKLLWQNEMMPAGTSGCVKVLCANNLSIIPIPLHNEYTPITWKGVDWYKTTELFGSVEDKVLANWFNDTIESKGGVPDERLADDEIV